MTIWICFAYWPSSFAWKTVCFARDKEATAATRIPAGRAAIRCADLRSRSSGRFRYRHRLQATGW